MSSPRDYTIFYDVVSGKSFDENQTLITNSNVPYMFFSEDINITYQYLNSEEKDTDGLFNDFYLGFVGSSISSSVVINDNYDPFITSTLDATLTAATPYSTCTLSSLSKVPRIQGTISFVDASANEELAYYYKYIETSTGVYDFYFSDSGMTPADFTPTYTYTLGAGVATINETPLVRASSVDQTDKDTGKFIVSLSANTEVLYDAIKGISALVDGVQIEHQVTLSGNTSPSFVSQLIFKFKNIIDYNSSVIPSTVPAYWTSTEIEDFMVSQDLDGNYALATLVGGMQVYIWDGSNAKYTSITDIATFVDGTIYKSYKGWYADETALTTAHATALDGDSAILGSTDSFWVWSHSGSAWVNSAVDISAIVPYTGATTDVVLGANDLSAADVKASGGFEFTATGGQKLTWNPDFYTVNIPTGLGPELQVGQEKYVIVYNETGSVLGNGVVVKIGSVFNDYPSVIKAKADVHPNFVGKLLVTTMVIPDASYGVATLDGRVTMDTSMWALNSPVYLSPTTEGALTDTPPIFPDYVLSIGRVLKVDSTVGILQVNSADTKEDTFNNFWNGVFRETFDFRTSSDGTTITGSLEPADGHDDMTMIFSDGFTMLDTNPAATITLTAGTDTSPQVNYVYIPQSTKVLTVSTTSWPTEEAIKVAQVVLQSAATTATNGALRNQNWNDAVENTDTNQGHLSHIGERIRQLPAKWNDGIEATCTINSAPTPDTVNVAVTSGHVYQMHLQTFTAQDTAVSDNLVIVNHPTTPYLSVTDLNTQLLDASNVTLNSTSFSFVLWGVCNKTGEASHLMINLPIGSYAFASPIDAIEDSLNYAVYDIPSAFNGVGFLIARFTFTYKNDVWTLEDTEDLRGKIPNTTAGGGGGGGGGVTSFASLTDTPSSYVSQARKQVVVNSAETALEFVSPPATTVYLPSATVTQYKVYYNASGTWTLADPDVAVCETCELFFSETTSSASGMTAWKLVTNVSWSFASSDIGKMVWLDDDGAVTVTVPDATSDAGRVARPVGYVRGTTSIFFSGHIPGVSYPAASV